MHIEPLVLEEAIKSGLFNSVESENMIHLSEKMKNYNVILISMDCCRADHLSCYGYHRNTTPNIDKLAKESALFKKCFSQSTYTLPSHTTMLTSLYPSAHGASIPYRFCLLVIRAC